MLIFAIPFKLLIFQNKRSAASIEIDKLVLIKIITRVCVIMRPAKNYYNDIMNKLY